MTIMISGIPIDIHKKNIKNMLIKNHQILQFGKIV